MKLVRDYYEVEVPSDYSENPEERAHVAFAQAETRTRLYCLPCLWAAIRDDGEMVTVRRTRYQSRKD